MGKKKDQKALNVVKCNAKEWNIDEQYKNSYLVDLIDSLYCIDHENLKQVVLEGNYFSKVFSFIEINLHVCFNQPDCSSRQEIEKYFSALNIPKLQYVFVNSSVKYSKEEMKSPIQQFTDDSLFWPVELGRQVQTNLYLR